MRRSRWVLLGVGIVVVLVAGGLLYARPLLLTATGYAAHNACAVELVAGRGPDAPAEDLPPNPLVPLLRTSVDADAGTARATLIGTFGATAFHTPGLGCTLADDRPSLTSPEPVVLAAPDAEWPEGEEVGSPPSSVDVAALDAVLDAAFAEDDPDGRTRGTRAVVVVHEGRIVAERYADGFDADTPQLGWSMAKSVTSAMVGRLVADGTIALDERGLRADWNDDRADITLEDLLRMRSGLAWDETYDLGTPITEMLYLRDDMGGFAAEQPLAHEIGSHQQYSSGTSNIVCDLLHERTGLGESMAHELIFRPLGMASAVLEPDAAGGLVCSSYLWATPRDWARFGLWIAQDGEWDGEQLLPDGWVAESSTVEGSAGGEADGHAAHWWANEQPDGALTIPEAPVDTFWASGHDGQRLFIIPSADLVVVRQGFTPAIPNAELGHGAMLEGVLDAVGAS